MHIPYVTLNNGFEIPQVGLGVWKASNAEAELAVKTAIDCGYRLIDTAAIYGNEVGVGRAIASSDVAREELFVTTKLWNGDQGYDTTIKAFEKSLGALGLEYVDLYLIHWPMPMKGTYIETWKAFEELYRDGRIKAIGVSNFKPHHLEELMSKTDITPTVNQIELHPRFTQAETREFCAKHDIKIESWSPLGGSANVRNMLDEPVLAAIGDKYDKSPAQVILRWHVQQGLIVIPKSIHTDRIQQNIDVFDFELSEEDMWLMATLDAHTRQGLDPDTMNHH